jgi:hypothetical protein
MLPLLPPTNTASGVSSGASASGARPSITRTLSVPWTRMLSWQIATPSGSTSIA